jgi:TatD DNase family protein
MYYIDTHAHLYAEEFESDQPAIIGRCVDAGVTKILLPNIDAETVESLQKLKANYPGICYAMMGLHPCSVTKSYREDLKKIESLLYNGEKYVAVGEIGIDLYWDQTLKKEQETAFLTQSQWALDLQLPIAIHTRNATREAILCLNKLNKQPGGVFHCFGGSIEEAREIINMGYYLGIGGVVTYKNSTLPEVLKQIDLKHILLETDAPYLPPVPFRGKRNESSYIPYIAEKLAEIYDVALSEIAQATSQNAEKLFDLK